MLCLSERDKKARMHLEIFVKQQSSLRALEIALLQCSVAFSKVHLVCFHGNAAKNYQGLKYYQGLKTMRPRWREELLCAFLFAVCVKEY